jgi:CheY-like chemotaxis protein
MGVHWQKTCFSKTRFPDFPLYTKDFSMTILPYTRQDTIFTAEVSAELDVSAQGATEATSMQPVGEFKNKSIAICDDNDDILGFLSAFLQSEGYSVTTAHDCDELLPALKKQPADLLLLDIWLPTMDGFDVLEQLRAHRFTMPVVLMTAHDHFMYRQYAEVVGVRDFVTKPINHDELLQKIKIALQA